ncbi:MAG: pyruvate/2-oxoglutarate dehydrogenase complex, dihydrolipoamide dehydrogenase component [Actinotalea sp.]|nr:pyruvate/2-oxoglutarate dehydrogenase complex, dihydrolipoamide dehydrogenase component [Actinotalea sp.]
MPQTHYDVVVIGAGAVGENVADRASRTGLSVVVVEQELVGGECSYWACMPSKALLRPGAVLAEARAVAGAREAIDGRLDRDAVLERRDAFTSHWDDVHQVRWLETTGLGLVRGRARLDGPRRVVVESGDGEDAVTLVAGHAVVVATGSEVVLPDVPGLADVGAWTSREATAVRDVPDSLAIIGGGVVAVEMATALADLGADVTVLVRGERLLPHLEPFAADAVAEGLRRIGVDLRLRTQVARATREDGAVVLELEPGGSLGVAQVLVATGRRPRTADVGLDTVGVPTDRALDVDPSGRATAVADGWLYGVGDVTGRTATTHQGKYDARVTGDAIAHRFGGSAEEVDDAEPWSRFRATADDGAVPQVVFTRPEVATVGRTVAQARESGFEVRAVQVPFSSVAGASLAADGYEGTASLVVDTEREVVVGATFVGQGVAELLHAATVAVVGEVPLHRLWHAVPAYPTLSEVWLRLLEECGL